jgi:subtilisin family serine protease
MKSFKPMWALAALVFTVGTAEAARIPNQYIVVLDAQRLGSASVPAAANGLVARVGGAEILQVYEHAVQGFAVRMSPVAATAMARNPLVKYIEPDSTMHLLDTEPNPPSYGLDRIDQRALPLDHAYNYPTNPGAGAHVYDIDTGLRSTHVDFAGRVGNGRNFASHGTGFLCVQFGVNCPAAVATDTSDCNGHGTHTAGTATGTTYGVAKKATIHSVRVFGCGGSTATSTIIAGVDWVTANRILPAAANMSLGGSASQTLDDSVRNMITHGVTVAIAAGNDSAADACGVSPARVAEAITVGASENNDAAATYSNIGTCLDIWAPGTNITSTWNTSDTATNVISGTSMATPHVAGAAARYLAANPTATPAQVQAALIAASTPNVITNPGAGSPNRLLYVNPTGP